ncbi:uncharacterized protein LOC121006090 [Bufo bufo]|uniref:uncharacterized protein LOC121006090 n=1 Tax=Bufo bufo TaxID=8384 RepID=UPI001ABDD016|nr:uncharacterized protein LOC121006090 [Bufo bufo]
MSSSSDAGSLPPRRHIAPSDPVASQTGSPAPARGRRGARRGRVLGSRVSTGQDEEEVIFYIDNDLLIQLVEARPALWDHTDRRHADHNATRLLWHEICKAIVPNWEDLRDRQRDQCRAQIMVRWRSIRDRYKKDYNEELRAPSGSVGTSRREYRYHAAVGFLRRTLELRRTTGSTRASEVLQEALPDEPATAGSSGLGQTTGQDTDVPLSEPPGDPTMATLAPVFQANIRRQRVGSSRQADYEDLTRLVYESLMGSSNRVATLENRLVRLQEGAVSALQMSPVQNFLNSLVPVMEQFTPDQLFEARRLVDCALWQVQHLPPSFPPSQPFPQSQSFLPSHSHPPSHSPSVALAPTRPFLPNVAEQPENRGVLYLL